MPRLTGVFANSAKPGTYYEDGGLMLRVGTDRWLRRTWRGTVNGKQTPIDFGHHPSMKVKEARSLDQGFRLAASEGMGPRTSGGRQGYQRQHEREPCAIICGAVGGLGLGSGFLGIACPVGLFVCCHRMFVYLPLDICRTVPGNLRPVRGGVGIGEIGTFRSSWLCGG